MSAPLGTGDGVGAIVKLPSQDWQHCRSCGTWWPVDTDFTALGVAVPTECPQCGQMSPFAPEIASSVAVPPAP